MISPLHLGGLLRFGVQGAVYAGGKLVRRSWFLRNLYLTLVHGAAVFDHVAFIYSL